MMLASLKRSLLSIYILLLLASCAGVQLASSEGGYFWIKTKEASKTYEWYKYSRKELDVICSKTAIACVWPQIPGGLCVVSSLYSREEAMKIIINNMSVYDHELKHCRGYIHP